MSVLISAEIEPFSWPVCPLGDGVLIAIVLWYKFSDAYCDAGRDTFELCIASINTGLLGAKSQLSEKLSTLNDLQRLIET